MESVLGVKFSSRLTAETKRLAWRLILDETARAAVDRIRLGFPEAKVEAIR